MLTRQLSTAAWFALCALLSGASNAQTFNGDILNTAGNSQIPSTGTGGCTNSPQNAGGTLFNNIVAGLPAGARVSSVQLNFTEGYDADLDIFLVAPNGQILELTTANGGSGSNYTNTVFRDGAPSITTGTAPFTGNFAAEGTTTTSACGRTGTITSLAAFTAGNGTWQLLIDDHTLGDNGTMLGWSITFQDFNGNILNTAGNSQIPSAGTGGCTNPPQNAGGTLFNNVIAGLPAGARVSSVQLNMRQGYDADLDIFLVAPNGQILELTTANGGSGSNYTDTVFRDGAPSITTGTAPFTGTFAAEGTTTTSACGRTGTITSLAAFTAGNGTWQLLIDDHTLGDNGTMFGWSISFQIPAAGPTATPVPALSSLGLAVLALLLGGAAFLTLRRRKG